MVSVSQRALHRAVSSYNEQLASPSTNEMGALKELELMDLHAMRELALPSLEKLVLIKMSSLEVCSSPSSLRRLTIHDCPYVIVSHPLPCSALISELSIKGVPTLPTMKVNQRCFTIKSNELAVDDKVLAFYNLRGIKSLEIKNCPNLVSLSSEAFSQLIAPEHLCISNCPNFAKSNIMSEIGQENSTSASSPVLASLKSVKIWTCGITGRWLTEMLSHSQSLEELSLMSCTKIKFLSISQPREIEGTSSLVSAAMTSAQDEHELKLPYNLLCSLKKLWVRSSRDLEFCGDSRDFSGFTSLTELHLHDCPKLISSLVCETKDGGTMEVGFFPPSLEDLVISRLPENLQSFTPQGLLSLKKLSLFSGPCLQYVRLHSCMALEQLRIAGCVQLAVLEGLQFLTSLQSLAIEMSLEQEQGGNQIQLFPLSLKELEIRALTDRVQSCLLTYLPTITKLEILESPQLTSIQLGCCTALKVLEIRNCKLLASVEGLQFIRNLTSLKVFNSPGLVSCLELVSHQKGASGIWSGLETLWIGDASVLSMPFCKQLTSLRRLHFSRVGKHRESMASLTEEQERALQLLTSLQELHFSFCKDLLSLPANLHSLTSLKRLSIKGCQRITKLPDMGLPPSLRHLELSRCSEELGMQCRMAATDKLSFMIDDKCVK